MSYVPTVPFEVDAPADLGWPLVFFVPGHPATQGSKMAWLTNSGKAAVRDSNKRNPQWRADVAFAARAAMGRRSLIAKPAAVALVLDFYIERPANHYKANHRRNSLRMDGPALAGRQV